MHENNNYSNIIFLKVSDIDHPGGECCHEEGKIVADVLGARRRLVGAD